MKKLLLLFTFIIAQAISPVELKLVEKVLTELFKEDKIVVYYPYPLKSKILIPVKSCKKAQIVLGDFNCSKPKFLFSYYNFIKDPNALAALYWRKGRPQLRIKEKTLKNLNIKPTKELMEYLE